MIAPPKNRLKSNPIYLIFKPYDIGEGKRVVRDCGMFGSIWQCWHWEGPRQSSSSVCILHVQLWFLNISCLLQNMSLYIASTIKMLMSENVRVGLFVLRRYLRVLLVQQRCIEQDPTAATREKIKLERAMMESVLRLKNSPFSLFRR